MICLWRFRILNSRWGSLMFMWKCQKIWKRVWWRVTKSNSKCTFKVVFEYFRGFVFGTRGIQNRQTIFHNPLTTLKLRADFPGILEPAPMPNRPNHKLGNVPKIEQTAFHRWLPVSIFPEFYFWDNPAFWFWQILPDDLPDYPRKCLDADPPGPIRTQCGKVQLGGQGSQCICHFVPGGTGFGHEGQN